MSSLRKVLSSRANGARSRGPVTPEGKKRSAYNAIRHGLLAKIAVIEDESREGFEARLGDYLKRLQPADGMEFSMIEEMASSYWRMRRAWALETRLFEKEIASQPAGDTLDRMADAFSVLAKSPALALIHRYETRLHLMHQRALNNFLLLRAEVPNEPDSTSEPSEPAANPPGAAGPEGTTTAPASCPDPPPQNTPSPDPLPCAEEAGPAACGGNAKRPQSQFRTLEPATDPPDAPSHDGPATHPDSHPDPEQNTPPSDPCNLLKNVLLLRVVPAPNKPSSISEHSGPVVALPALPAPAGEQ